MKLGESIRTLRKKRGLSQKELAKKAGISSVSLCGIENDKNMPTKGTIKVICNALNVPVSFLLFSCITEDEIPEEKRPVFRALQKPIIELFDIERI